jgi:hypothetical protein
MGSRILYQHLLRQEDVRCHGIESMFPARTSCLPDPALGNSLHHALHLKPFRFHAAESHKNVC